MVELMPSDLPSGFRFPEEWGLESVCYTGSEEREDGSLRKAYYCATIQGIMVWFDVRPSLLHEEVPCLTHWTPLPPPLPQGQLREAFVRSTPDERVMPEDEAALPLYKDLWRISQVRNQALEGYRQTRYNDMFQATFWLVFHALLVEHENRVYEEYRAALGMPLSGPVLCWERVIALAQQHNCLLNQEAPDAVTVLNVAKGFSITFPISVIGSAIEMYFENAISGRILPRGDIFVRTDMEIKSFVAGVYASKYLMPCQLVLHPEQFATSLRGKVVKGEKFASLIFEQEERVAKEEWIIIDAQLFYDRRDECGQVVAYCRRGRHVEVG